MTATATKLADLGTAGLVQFAITGSRRLYGARRTRAGKIIFRRYGREAQVIFLNVCNRDLMKLIDKENAALA